MNVQDIALEAVRRSMANQSPAETLHWMQGAISSANVDSGDGLRSKWKFYNLQDAYAPRPPREYIVEGLLTVPSLSIWYGSPGSFKSMLLMDLCACIVAGKTWLDPLPGDAGEQGVTFRTRQAGALWIDLDNGKEESHDRIESMSRAHELPEDAPFEYVTDPMPRLDASDAGAILDLVEAVRGSGIKVIVIDNLGQIVGDIEENSSRMALVMGNLRQLAERAGCAVIVIHHVRKQGGNGDANGVRKGDSLRGSSAIEAALDLAVLVERLDGTDKVAIIPTKVRRYIAFTGIGAHFTYSHKDGTKDLAAARFFSSPALDKREVELKSLRNTIVDEVRAAPGLHIKTLIDNVRDRVASAGQAAPGISKVRGTIKAMGDDGVLNLVANGAAIKVYPA